MKWDIFVQALTALERKELINELLTKRVESRLLSTEMALAISGQRTEAIKAVKQRLNLSLKEAHDEVYSFLEGPK